MSHEAMLFAIRLTLASYGPNETLTVVNVKRTYAMRTPAMKAKSEPLQRSIIAESLVQTRHTLLWQTTSKVQMTTPPESNVVDPMRRMRFADSGFPSPR